MILGVCAVMLSLPGAQSHGSFPGFLLAFLVLFAMAGIGSGSSFCMIPVAFSNWHLTRAAGLGPAALSRDRKSGGMGKSVAVRVVPGCRRIIKKKKKSNKIQRWNTEN